MTRHFIVCTVTGLLFAAGGCGNSHSSFSRGLFDAISKLENGTDAVTVDSDKDGLVDGLDLDGDGAPDVEVTEEVEESGEEVEVAPVEESDGSPSGSSSSSSSSSSNTPPFHCRIRPQLTVIREGGRDANITIDEPRLASWSGPLLYFTGNDSNITIDMAGVPLEDGMGVTSVVVIVTGKNNSIRVKNTISNNFCAEQYGTNNRITLEDTSYFNWAEVGGSGDRHSYNVRYRHRHYNQVGEAVIFGWLGGGEHCVSVLPRTRAGARGVVGVDFGLTYFTDGNNVCAM